MLQAVRGSMLQSALTHKHAIVAVVCVAPVLQLASSSGSCACSPATHVSESALTVVRPQYAHRVPTGRS